MIIGYVSINKDLLLLFTYEFFLCQRVATVFIYVRYLPLAESGWLYTYLRIEHHAQQNGSHVQLFTETEYVLDPKWTEFRIGSCARSWAWRLNLSNRRKRILTRKIAQRKRRGRSFNFWKTWCSDENKQWDEMKKGRWASPAGKKGVRGPCCCCCCCCCCCGPSSKKSFSLQASQITDARTN